jgi:hypothetical protein
MNLKPNAVRERKEKALLVPPWVRRFGHGIVVHHRLRMLMSGTYFQKPFDFALYTFESPEKRVTRHVAKPTARWPGRGGGPGALFYSSHITGSSARAGTMTMISTPSRANNWSEKSRRCTRRD